jgi:hypothetical protein
MVTVYNADIARFFQQRRYPYIWVKPFGQTIYSTFSLQIPPGKIIQDGEGDYVFT